MASTASGIESIATRPDAAGVVVLEAIWTQSHQLCLWAHEPVHGPDAALDASSGLPAGDLLKALPAARGAGGGLAVTLTLLLPGGGALRRQRWPALAVTTNAAVDVLPALAQEAPPGVVMGPSVHVFARLAELALELLAGGRVLPSLLRQGERHVARWLPRLEPGDQDRVRQLATALPAVARAEVQETAQEARSSDAIAEDFLRAAVDAGRSRRGALDPATALRRIGGCRLDGRARRVGRGDERTTRPAGPAAPGARSLDRRQRRARRAVPHLLPAPAT